jgi:hypothetical protein
MLLSRGAPRESGFASSWSMEHSALPRILLNPTSKLNPAVLAYGEHSRTGGCTKEDRVRVRYGFYGALPRNSIVLSRGILWS